MCINKSRDPRDRKGSKGDRRNSNWNGRDRGGLGIVLGRICISLECMTSIFPYWESQMVSVCRCVLLKLNGLFHSRNHIWIWSGPQGFATEVGKGLADPLEGFQKGRTDPKGAQKGMNKQA